MRNLKAVATFHKPPYLSSFIRHFSSVIRHSLSHSSKSRQLQWWFR